MGALLARRVHVPKRDALASSRGGRDVDHERALGGRVLIGKARERRGVGGIEGRDFRDSAAQVLCVGERWIAEKR